MTEYLLTIGSSLAVLFLAYGLSHLPEIRQWLRKRRRHQEWLSTPFEGSWR